MKRITILLAALMLAANAYARLSTPYTGDDAWCVGSDGAEVCVDSSGNLLPTTDNDTTLGTSTYLWATIHAYDLSLSDDLTVSGDATVTGDITVTDDATVNGKLLVDNDTAADTVIRVLGASSQVGDLLLIETSPGTDVLRVKSLGEVLVGVGTPDTTQGEGDLYIASNLEVDAGSRFDGALDINAGVDIDNAAAATTGIAVTGASAQTADLLLAETSAGTDILRVTPTGVLVRLLTMAQVDVTTPIAGELVIVTDRTSTLYGICIATGTAVAQYKLASGTDVQTSGCGTGL